MGLLTIIRKLKQKEKEMRILVLGLDNAGKTTILKRINGEDVHSISPTLGFAISTLEHKEYKLNIWDVGGQKSFRAFWQNYFESTDGLVYVVDSADRRRLLDSRNELRTLLDDERLDCASLLIFANKQDLPGCIKCDDIEEILELKSIKTHAWKIFSCSAFSGDNLEDGISWLVDDIATRIYNDPGADCHLLLQSSQDTNHDHTSSESSSLPSTSTTS